MGSLTACAAKLAKNISPDDLAKIREYADGFQREGTPTGEAQIQAVELAIDLAVEDANSVARGVRLEPPRVVTEGRTPNSRSDKSMMTALGVAGEGVKFGRVRAVGRVPVKLAQIASGWMDMLGADTKVFSELGVPEELVIVDLESLRKRTGNPLGGSAAGVATFVTKQDGTRVAVIGLDVDRIKADVRDRFLTGTESKQDAALVETLAHEFGHVVERAMFSRRTPEEQEAIVDAYMRWLSSVMGMGGSQAALQRLTEIRRELLRKAVASGESNIGWENDEYAKGYREWAADHIARWLLSNAKPQSVVDKFFASVAKVLRQIYSRLTGSPLPQQEVSALLTRMVEDASAWRAGRTDLGGVGAMNAEAYNRRMGQILGGAQGTALSITAADVREVDLLAIADNEAMKAFKEAERQASNAERSLTRGLVDAISGSGPKVKAAFDAVSKSVLGKKLLEAVFAVSTRLQMERLMGDDKSFVKFLREFNDATAEAETIANDVRHPIDKVMETANTLAPKTKLMLMKVMHDARMLRMHPERPFDDEAHRHIQDNPTMRGHHARLQSMWRMLNEADSRATDVYIRLRDGLSELNQKILAGQIAQLEAEIKALTDETTKGEMTEAKKGKLNALKGQIAQLEALSDESKQGPWFPLRRYGDYVVKVPLPQRVHRDVDDDLFETWDDAERVMKRLKVSNPNDTFAIKEYKNDDGETMGFVVTQSRTGVFFFDSIAAAEASRDDMIALTKQMWIDDNVDRSAIDEFFDNLDPKAFNPRKLSEVFYEEKAVPASIIERLRDMKSEGMPPSIIEAMERLALEADARYTMAASALPSRNVIGASHDMLRASAEWAYAASHTYGTIMTFSKSRDAWKGMQKLAKDTSNTMVSNKRMTALNALAVNDRLTKERRELTTFNEVANWASKVSTFMSLSFSPAYLAINATQPLVLGAPVLSAQTYFNRETRKYETLGVAEATKYFSDAMRGTGATPVNGLWAATANGYRDFVQHLNSFVGRPGKEAYTPEQMFQALLDSYARNPKERALLTAMRNRGDLDFGHLAALQDTLASTKAEQKANSLLRMGMAFAQHVETMNRTVTALATYRAAVERLGFSEVKLVDGELDLTDSYDTFRYVSDMVNDTMINYSMVNRPNLFKYSAMGPILQFKMYLQGVWALFIRFGAMALSGDARAKKEGWAALRNLIASHAVFSGVLGLGPGLFVAQQALLATGLIGDQDDDKYKDIDTLTHEFIKTHFGDGFFGTAIERGLPAALLNADLSARAGIPSLIDTRFINVAPSDSPKEGVDAVFIYALGPVYANIARAIGHGGAGLKETVNWLRGESMGDEALREFAKASPSGFRALIEAARYYNNGLTELDGDRILKPEDFKSSSILIRALGVTPMQVSRVYDQRMRERGTMQRITQERDDVLRMYTIAKTRGDWREVERARQRIRDFNRTVPNAFKIRPDQMARATSSRVERESGVVDRRMRAVREEVLK